MILTNIFKLKKPEGTDPVEIQDFNDNIDIIEKELSERPTKSGDTSSMIAKFTTASTRTNIVSGDTHETIFGKIAKWFSDLKKVAFSGSYNDLSDKPSIPTTMAWGSITGKPSTYTPSAHSHSYLPLTGGEVNGNLLAAATDATQRYFQVKNSLHSGHLCVSTGGNFGVYDNTFTKWLVRCDTSGKVYFDEKVLGEACTKGVDTSPVNGGTYLITSGGVYAALQKYLPLAGGKMTGDLYVRNGKKIFVDNGSSIGVGGWFYSSGKNTYVVSNTNGSSDSYLQLQANGAVQCLAVGQENTFVPCNASAHLNASSRRYKDNIKPLTEEEALKILEVETVTYDYKEGVVLEAERYDKRGVIAEDVADIIPTAVSYKNVEGVGEVPDSVDYSKFIPYLIKMVQMQKDEINELKKELAELKTQLEKERN